MQNLSPTMTDFAIKELVRFHPIIGGNHDGKRYRIRGFTVIDNGERRALLEGKGVTCRSPP